MCLFCQHELLVLGFITPVQATQAHMWHCLLRHRCIMSVYSCMAVWEALKEGCLAWHSMC